MENNSISIKTLLKSNFMKYLILSLIISFAASNASSQIRIEDRYYEVVLYKTLDMNTNETTTHTSTGSAKILHSPVYENTLVITYEGSVGATFFMLVLDEGVQDGKDYVENYSVLLEDGVKAAIFYPAKAETEDGIKYTIGMAMPDAESGILHQIFLSNEVGYPDFSRKIIEDEEDNAYWNRLEEVFNQILDTDDFNDLKGEENKYSTYNEYLTKLDLRLLQGTTPNVKFAYDMISGWGDKDSGDQFIRFTTYESSEWMLDGQSEEERESDVLKLERVIDKVIPDNLVKVFVHYVADGQQSMASFLNSDNELGMPNRNDIFDEVYWVDKSELKKGVGNLEKFYIKLDYEIYHNNHIVKVKFNQKVQ